MNSSLETLPNEIFLNEIFPYCTLIDLTYAFSALNHRFTELMAKFLGKKIHSLRITSRVSYQQLQFLVDDMLPQLEENHRFESIETTHGQVFVKFLHNLSRINTNYLENIAIDNYIDPPFDSVVQCVDASPQLKRCRLKVLTNVDRSWANGRKWIRWFETLTKLGRDQTLRDLHISVWVIDGTRAVHFDREFWNPDGSYIENRQWKVRLQPDHELHARSNRRAVQFSRANDDHASDCQTS